MLVGAMPVTAQPELAPPPHAALILYDSWHEKTDGAKADALQLEQVLGHFPIGATLLSLDAYRPGMLAQYRYGFFIGFHKQVLVPKAVLTDIQQFSGTFCWLNHGIAQLGAPFLAQRGLKFERLDPFATFTRVRYHDATVKKGDDATNVVSITNTARCTVFATTSSTKATVPYIMRSGAFWYIADSPFAYSDQGSSYYVFCDVLHDIVGIDHVHSRRALVRIEDVSQITDQRQLRDIAERMRKENVPYLVALIPEYVDPHAKVDIPMTRNKSFVEAIRYMTTHGASLVMHGSTHRYKGTTADDYEFWNADGSKPIAEDSEAYVRKHLQSGLDICFDSGLYPLAWETPHYAASQRDYAEIARYFSTAVEQRILLDNEYDFGQSFPFTIKRDIFGQQIIPENLGYISMEMHADQTEDIASEQKQLDAILQEARDARVLRDVSVGAFIHPFISRTLLTKLVEGLKGLGYTFIDLRNENNRVQMADMLIGTGKMTGKVHLRNQYLREFYLTPNGDIKREHVSQERMTGTFSREIDVPAGWIYICYGVHQRPPSWWEQMRNDLLRPTPKSEPAPMPEPAASAILWDAQASGPLACDQAAMLQALTAMGAAPTKLALENFSSSALTGYNLLAIPQASARKLNNTEINALDFLVRDGLNVVLDGYSAFADRLKINHGSTAQVVNGVQDSLTSSFLAWRQPELVSLPAFGEKVHRLF
ncbi:MAG TPA: polysaccharide deacetylase family protein, partial [Armatimonadota bacterium]